MKLKIVCWNVQNLSETFRESRPAKTNKVIERCAIIGDLIINSCPKPDIVVLLECGRDIAELKAHFGHHLNLEYYFTHSKPTPSGCKLVISNLTDTELEDLEDDKETDSEFVPETYLFLIRKSISKEYGFDKEGFLVFSGVESNHFPYRDGFLLPGNYFDILTLHAPSPAHNIEIIQEVIRKVAKKSILTNRPILLMGDLNIKETKYSPYLLSQENLNSLEGGIPTNTNNSSFKHVGPFIPSTESPQKTSLKRFYNMIKKNESGSEVYDQFWLFDKDGIIKVIENPKIFDLKVNTVELEDKLLEDTIKEITHIIGEYRFNLNVRSSKRDVSTIIDCKDEIIDCFSEITSISYLISIVYGTASEFITKYNEFKDIFSTIKKIFDEIDEIKKSTDISKNQVSCSNNFHQGILENIIYLKSLYSFKNRSRYGLDPADVKFQDIYVEKYISDHLPIEITIEIDTTIINNLVANGITSADLGLPPTITLLPHIDNPITNNQTFNYGRDGNVFFNSNPMDESKDNEQ